MENVSPTEGQVAPEVEKSDPWEGAEAVFDAPEEKQEEKPQEKGSQLEAEVPEYLKRLNLAKIPHKYKPLAEEILKQTVTEYETKYKTDLESASKEAGQYKEAILELVNIFKDVAGSENPDQALTKLAKYASEHGHHIGIDPSVATRFQRTEKPVEVPKISLAEITKNYAEKLLAVPEDNPRGFVEVLNQQNLEIADAVQKSVLGQVGQLLKLYHENYVAPDKKAIQEFQTKAQQEQAIAEHSAKKSAWNEAANGLKAKHEDFDKYKPQILKAIQEKKTLAATKDLLNENPDVGSLQEFLEQVYLLVSHQDRLESLKKPQGGLPPSKFTNTKKTGGGGNWDRVWENTSDLYD